MCWDLKGCEDIKIALNLYPQYWLHGNVISWIHLLHYLQFVDNHLLTHVSCMGGHLFESLWLEVWFLIERKVTS